MLMNNDMTLGDDVLAIQLAFMSALDARHHDRGSFHSPDLIKFKSKSMTHLIQERIQN